MSVVTCETVNKTFFNFFTNVCVCRTKIKAKHGHCFDEPQLQVRENDSYSFSATHNFTWVEITHYFEKKNAFPVTVIKHANENDFKRP